jgi:hypothetical protein
MITMSELHYGNSKGQLLGPYDPNEIGPQVRAQALLRQDGTEVWAIRANSREDALAKLDKARKQAEAERGE